MTSNDVVYAVMIKSLNWGGVDEVLDLYMDRDNAQKCIDKQLYPHCYHIEKWKVKI